MNDQAVAGTVENELAAVYVEIMWLARRTNVRPSVARAWYTHARSEKLKRHVRRFTGQVSRAALEANAVCRLEHFKRIQTTLTQLVKKHLVNNLDDPADFVRTVLDYEQVHIVTLSENYAAMKAKGDYAIAGIELVDWRLIPTEKRSVLWRKMLYGKVANAKEFAL